MRMVLALVIMKVLVPSAGSLIRIHQTLLGSILSLCLLGKRVSVQVTRTFFFLQNSVSALSNQPFPVDLFTKCNAHCLEVGVDHAWVDDIGLYVSIPCFRALEGLARTWKVTRLLSCITGLLQYATCRCTHTAGVHGAGVIDRSGSFLTLVG